MMETTGIYGDQLVKLLKLTDRMVDALKDTRFLPAPATVKALAKRGLMSDVAGSYGNLTADGEHVRIHLTSKVNVCATCEQAAPVAAPVLADWEIAQLERTKAFTAYTEDHVLIIHGMAVWTNEMIAGTVDLSRVGTDGWFHVAYDMGGDNGFRRVLMNAERIATTFQGCRAVDHLGRLYHVLGSDSECVGCFPHLADAGEVYPDMATEVEPITSGTAESVAILSGMVTAGMSADALPAWLTELVGACVEFYDRDNGALRQGVVTRAYPDHGGYMLAIAASDDSAVVITPGEVRVIAEAIPSVIDTGATRRFYDMERGRQRSGPLVGTYDPMGSYGEPMEAADFDRMNADAEHADIESENAREAAAQEAEDQAFDVMLAELFPGDDDPYTSYAECRDQLTAEREGCSDCQGFDDTIRPCAVHASVEVWVRAEAVEAERAQAAQRARDMERAERAERAGVTSWKTSTGKHKRHGRTRARQVARTRR